MTEGEIFERFDDWHLDHLYALSQMDGWGKDNDRTARVCATTHNGLMTNAALRGATVSEMHYRTEQSYMPKIAGQPDRSNPRIPVQSWGQARRNLGWQ